MADRGAYVDLLERRLDQAIEEFGLMLDFVRAETPTAIGTMARLANLKANFEATQATRQGPPPEEMYTLDMMNGYIVECPKGARSLDDCEPICTVATWFVYRMGEQ